MLTSAAKTTGAAASRAAANGNDGRLPLTTASANPSTAPPASSGSSKRTSTSSTTIPKIIKKIASPPSVRRASSPHNASAPPYTSSSLRKLSMQPTDAKATATRTAKSSIPKPTSRSIALPKNPVLSAPPSAPSSVPSAPSSVQRAGRTSVSMTARPPARASTVNVTPKRAPTTAVRTKTVATPAKAADSSLEKLVAELKKQVADQVHELSTKDLLLAEKEEALCAAQALIGGADSNGTAEAAKLLSQVSSLEATVTSLRAQISELREENVALGNHVDKLNARIIAMSDKHQREIVDFQAAVDSGKALRQENVNLVAEITAIRDERDARTERLAEIGGIAETLDAARAEKTRVEEELESTNRRFAELSVACNKSSQQEQEALRDAEAMIEQLTMQLAELTESRAIGQTEDLESEVQELRKAKITFTEDLRLRDEKVANLEAEYRSQLQVLNGAKDAAESAAAALRAEVARLTSEFEKTTAARTLDEVPTLRSEATLLADDNTEMSTMGEPPHDGAAQVRACQSKEMSAIVHKPAGESESVPAYPAASICLRCSSVVFAKRLDSDSPESQTSPRTDSSTSAWELLGSLPSENTVLPAADATVNDVASCAVSDGSANHEAGNPAKPEDGVANENADEFEKLKARISALTTELERYTDVNIKLQAAETALAKATEAHGEELQRAAEIEKRLKCKEEKVKSLEGAMAKMKPPAPPFTNSDTERFLKRELERKDSIILELQTRCAERAMFVKEDAGMLDNAMNERMDRPSIGEVPLKQELERKESLITELRTTVERVKRVHAEDVHSIQSKCRREITDERQRSKDALDAAQKENDILVKLVQQLQTEVLETQQEVGHSAQ